MNKFTFLSLFCILSLQANELDDLFEMSIEDLLNVEVTTTSKYAERIDDSPANIHVFTEQTIKERGYQSVDDLLASLPGVTVNKFTRSSPYNQVNIRGISGNNKFLILLNGVRISSPAGVELAISKNYPIYNASRVEVVLGGASVVYGADAFMGVVNIITTNREDTAEVQVMAGSDKYFNAFANLTQTLDSGLKVNLAVSGYRSQDYEFADNYPELYTQPAPTNVENGDYNFVPNKDLTFFASVANENFEFGINHFEHQSSLDFIALPTTSSFDGEAKDQDRITTLYTKANFELSNEIHSQTMLYYSRYEKDHDTYFKNKFSNFDKGYKYAKTDRYSLTQDFTYALDEHTLSAGLAFDYFNVIPIGADLPEKYDTSSSSTSQDLFYSGTQTPNSIPIDFLEYSYKNYGVYLQDNYKMGEKFRFVAGLRYDYNTLYGNTTNPRVALLYKARETDHFKLMYSKAFLAPAANRVYRQFGSFAGFQVGGLEQSYFYHVANADLKPEEVQSIEFNYDHYFDTYTHFKLAPYYSEVDNAIVSEFHSNANDTTSIQGANLVNTESFENAGKSTVYGVDLSIDNAINYDSLVLKNWLNLSYTDGNIEVKGTKSELSNLTKYQLKAGSTAIYREKYFFTPKIIWLGATTTGLYENGSTTQRQTSSPYAIVDLNLQIKLTQGLFLKSDIYNLFDTKYYNATTQESASSGFMDKAPQPGRVISAGLYYKF